MNHGRKFLFVGLALIAVLCAPPGVRAAEESEIVQKFIGAYSMHDEAAMAAVIEQNKDRIPAEITTLLEETFAAGLAEEDKDARLYIAELMARSFRDVTGDIKPLVDVKKRSMDARLGPQVRTTPEGGAHVVEFPKPTETVRNVFKPNNIVIKAGDTVRWVNNDEEAHIFSTMPAISTEGVFSPRVEPGKSWEKKFEKPGDYYFICFIHRSMLGKIAVEGGAAPTEAPATPATVAPAPAAPAAPVKEAPAPAAPATPATVAPAPAAPAAPAKEAPKGASTTPAAPAPAPATPAKEAPAK
jgi:plastocyanin